MNWFYALGGQQQGPVDDARLDELLAAGTITLDTLVWREGLTNWQPLRLARPVAGTPPVAVPPPGVASTTGSSPTPGPGEVQCAECGKFFSRDDVIQYDTAWVCAACKPIFLQRLREGASPSATFAGLVNEDQLLARDYRIEIGESLTRAWKLFSEHSGTLLGVTLVMGALFLGVGIVVGLMVTIARAMMPAAAQYVMPFVNQLVIAVVTGPIAGGYFWFLLQLIRGQQAGVSEAFAGFGKRAGQLVLCSLVQGIVQLVAMAPLLIVMASAGFNTTLRRGGTPDFSPALLAAFLCSIPIAVIAMTYFSTVWTHSFLLIMDKNYKFVPALKLSWRVVHKRWWMTWVFLLVAGIIGGAGALVCCVGLLATFPIFLAMRVWLYEDNFRDLARQESN